MLIEFTMGKTLRSRIGAITDDETRSLEERMDAVFKLRREMAGDDEPVNQQNDIDFFTGLIEMVERENGPHLHDLDLLKLYTLLAETYVELDRYEPLKKVSCQVLELLRDECTRWEYMAETMPRILDAVGESVYNHNLYELYLHFIRKAYSSDCLDESLKGRARKMLKLRLLLEDGADYDYRLFDAELQKAVAALFTPEELMKIMLNPQLGHLRKDPVEYTFRWEEIYYDVEAKLEYRFANAPRHMGFCFMFWDAKRQLLADEYGISWRSPAQMNPRVMFD